MHHDKLKTLLFFFILFINSIPITSQTCLYFDGDDQAVIPVSVSQSMGTNDFTLEAYVNGREDEVWHATILSNRTGGINNGFHFFFHSYWGGSQHKMLSLRYNGINWFHLNNGDLNDKILDGSCHHVAVTKESSTMSFYVDGFLIGRRENMPIINISTGAPILIGSDPFSSEFTGTIDNVRIWNIARSQAEIQYGIDNEIDPESNGLLGYWNMSDGSGQVITDLTNQNDASLGSSSGTDFNDPTWGASCCGLIVEDCPDIPETTSIDYTICMGESVLVNGIEYNSAGIYTQDLLTEEGCDSILQITVESAIVLDSMHFYNGCMGDLYSVNIGGVVFDEDNPFGIVLITSEDGCEILVEVDLSFEDCSDCVNATPGLNLQILKSENNVYSIYYARYELSLVKGDINQQKICDYLMYIKNLYNHFRSESDAYYLDEEELIKLLSDMEHESVIKF